jgi:hypothetical protein
MDHRDRYVLVVTEGDDGPVEAPHHQRAYRVHDTPSRIVCERETTAFVRERELGVPRTRQLASAHHVDLRDSCA